MTYKQKTRFSSLESIFSNIQVKYINLQKDETLYKNSVSPDSFYLILNGSIGLKNERDTNGSVLRKIKKDEFFGLEEILDNVMRRQTAVALEKSDLLKIKFNNIPKNANTSNYDQFLKVKSADDLLMSMSKTSTEKNLFSIQEVNGQKVVSFYGRHGNLNNAVLFRNFLFKLIDEGNKDLIINLLACKTIDSTFLGSLVAALKKVSSLGGSLKLVSNENINSWLFVVTKMDNVFEIYGTLDDAVKS